MAWNGMGWDGWDGWDEMNIFHNYNYQDLGN